MSFSGKKELKLLRSNNLMNAEERLDIKFCPGTLKFKFDPYSNSLSRSTNVKGNKRKTRHKLHVTCTVVPIKK